MDTPQDYPIFQFLSNWAFFGISENFLQKWPKKGMDVEYCHFSHIKYVFLKSGKTKNGCDIT